MTKVLIAGIAGASLGTEILKSLKLAGRYTIYGCDISPLAYGHYCEDFCDTFVPEETSYAESIASFCHWHGIGYIIPGGEKPNNLLVLSRDYFEKMNIKIVTNSTDIVQLCSSKNKLFEFLRANNIAIPYIVDSVDSIKEENFPLIIKPSEGSGGSSFTYIARDRFELDLYYKLIVKNGLNPAMQEYIPHAEGEFTVGILSSARGKIIGSIALKRSFASKLSIAFKSDKFLISSGYTQGYIRTYENVTSACIKIAKLLKSTGPINIQGRVRNNCFFPFEINPRFSASTYLRSLAGLNEIDFYLQNLVNGEEDFSYNIKEGYYARSFEERYIPFREDIYAYD